MKRPTKYETETILKNIVPIKLLSNCSGKFQFLIYLNGNNIFFVFHFFALTDKL